MGQFPESILISLAEGHKTCHHTPFYLFSSMVRISGSLCKWSLDWEFSLKIENFRGDHIDWVEGVPVSGFPPWGRKRGTCTRASGQGPRGSGSLRLARQRWRWRRGEGGGLSQEGRCGGDWPPEVRGQLRAAAIRKGEAGHCPSLCSGPTAAALPLLHALGLRLGLFRFPGSAPLLLALAGGTMDVGWLKVEVWGDKRLGLARPTAAAGLPALDFWGGISSPTAPSIRQTTPPSTDLSYAPIFDDFMLGCGE